VQLNKEAKKKKIHSTQFRQFS